MKPVATKPAKIPILPPVRTGPVVLPNPKAVSSPAIKRPNGTPKQDAPSYLDVMRLERKRLTALHQERVKHLAKLNDAELLDAMDDQLWRALDDLKLVSTAIKLIDNQTMIAGEIASKTLVAAGTLDNFNSKRTADVLKRVRRFNRLLSHDRSNLAEEWLNSKVEAAATPIDAVTLYSLRKDLYDTRNSLKAHAKYWQSRIASHKQKLRSLRYEIAKIAAELDVTIETIAAHEDAIRDLVGEGRRTFSIDGTK